VGGDFFDFIQGGGGILTFTVGDVSGKGMPAALLMAMLRTVMRDKADTAAATKPEQLLEQINTALYQDFSDVDMFATVFIGQYDYQQHLLYYANDGHAPVIFRPAAGRAHLLPADAPPLGVLDFNLAQQHVIAFQPGDLLVITTDGINEAENSCGEMLGYDRLIAAVEALATADVAVIAEELFARATAFAGGATQADDQTLLVLKRNISQ
jgi:sigma-B regulation protein RsbU (phosphoserine phosphatase)